MISLPKSPFLVGNILTTTPNEYFILPDFLLHVSDLCTSSQFTKGTAMSQQWYICNWGRTKNTKYNRPPSTGHWILRLIWIGQVIWSIWNVRKYNKQPFLSSLVKSGKKLYSFLHLYTLRSKTLCWKCTLWVYVCAFQMSWKHVKKLRLMTTHQNRKKTSFRLSKNMAVQCTTTSKVMNWNEFGKCQEQICRFCKLQREKFVMSSIHNTSTTKYISDTVMHKSVSTWWYF